MMNIEYSSESIATYVVNLRRRPDRRAWMTARLPNELPATFTSDLDVVTDGQELQDMRLDQLGLAPFAWHIASGNPWWSRPLKFGEIGCSVAHLAVWRHASEFTDTPFVLVLEDDADLVPGFLPSLLAGLGGLAANSREFDLLYLGRYLLAPDTPTSIPGLVVPGYSHCTFAYLLTRAGLESVLSARFEEAIVPVDEFLPALYMPHPREDLRRRFPPRLSALAFDPPLVIQRPKHDAGSDTEDSEFVTT